jgi:hypothetical protein
VIRLATLALALAVSTPSWTPDTLEARVLEELAADGVQLPPRALEIGALPDDAWRVELRSDGGESRWRDLARLPDALEPAAATVRMVVLELMAAHEPRSGSDAWRPRT